MSMGFCRRYLFLVILLVLGACSGPPPYVHKAREFDRNASNFGQDPKDIENVTVCYAKSGTTPAEVRKTAQDECAKFNKEVRFLKQDYSTCPLSAPVSAFFECYIPQPAYPPSRVGTVPRTGPGTGSGPATDYGNYGQTGVGGPAPYYYPNAPSRLPFPQTQ